MKIKMKISQVLYQSLKTLTILIGTSGCTHYYYVPNAHNVPLFQEKHEARLSAGFCVGDEYVGRDYQAAVSVTDHIGIQVNGFFAEGEKEYEKFRLLNFNNDEPEIIHNTGSGHFFEVGPGFFLPLPNHERIVLETYTGLGFGSVSSGYNSQSSNLKFRRYSLQPSIGFTGKVFDIALSTRIAILKYSDIYYQSNIPGDEATYLNCLRESNPSFLVEPALTIRVGYKYVKLQGQLGLSENISIPDFRDNINFNMTIFVAITDKYNNKQ